MKDSNSRLNLSQMDPGEQLDAPNDPGPALAGRTPLVGSVRRSQGLPVLRDELKDEFGQAGKGLFDF